MPDLLEVRLYESVEEARGHPFSYATQSEALVRQSWRGTNQVDLGEWTLLVVGGSGWGDDPNDAYTVADAVARVPRVARAIGFDWPAKP